MKVDMTALYEDAAIAWMHNCDSADAYRVTCNELAEAYGLWDESRTAPLWLSFVVQGIARNTEAGLLDMERLRGWTSINRG